MKPTGFYVYIAASLRRTLYTGMTRDISTRLQQHKAAWVAGFGAKYRTNRLVWCEIAESFEAAREREAQIKRWRRAKKLKLIGNENPFWMDLCDRIG
ncbi:MAG TPA: GIY-YIG nuclease family protein [Dehalococcoidia bacterium]|nr:GIY-YIG nuclease family protein [Dehalococcoidia bacterium]